MNLGKIKYGVFNCVSYNGFKLDVLKSGLQKFIRRGMVEKSLYCLNEILLFRRIGDEKRVKGIISNLRNRLLIILNEDIGMCNYNMFDYFNKKINEWEESKDDRIINDIVYLFCKSKKVRLCSHVRGYYKNKYMNEEKFEKYYKNKNFDECKEEVGKEFYKDKDSDDIKKYIDGFVDKLKKKNYDLFYWFFKILDYKGKVGRRNRRSKTGSIILEIMKDIVGDSDDYEFKKLCKIVEYWYWNRNNSRNENWLYICNLIIFYIEREKISFEKLENVELDYDEIKNRNLDENHVFEFDDFVIDMHTCDGKNTGKNKKDFALEGSVVENECEELKKKKFEKVYNKIKLFECKNEKSKKKRKVKRVKKEEFKKIKIKINDDLEKKLEIIDFKKLMNIKEINDLNDKLCREKTCGGKAMTFCNNDKKMIVKEHRKSFNYGRDQIIIDELKNIFGLRKMNGRRIMSNMIVSKINKKKSEWKDNMKFENKNGVYVIMDMFDNIGSLVKNKNLRNDDKVKIEYLKILLFRGIFRVSDSNYTNVLVNENNELLSIDENNIGSRKCIFDKKFNIKNYDKREIDNVINDLLKDKENKLKIIKEKFEEYEMEIFYKMVEERMNNLKKIVYDEVKMFWDMDL
jgi:hypothetical protein